MKITKRSARACLAALFLVAGNGIAAAQDELTHEQAVSALKQDAAQARQAGVKRLGEIGTMSDVQALLNSLRDADDGTREEAERSLWRVWARSGDAQIDAQLARGVGEMGEGNYARALSTFDEIVRQKPDFAEGWNKRATLYFLTGQYLKSMKDVEEVLKRNPNHFGALAGYGQIHFELKNYERALEYFQRALNVNPNLSAIANLMDKLERRVEKNKDGQI